MILSYDLPDDLSNKESGVSSPKSTKSLSHSSSTSNIATNIFVYDAKYSKTFAKHKAQNDDIFYEKFEDLKLGDKKKNYPKPEIGASSNDSQLSVKEDNFINTDVLKLLNSSHKKTNSVSESSLNISAMIEEDMKKEKEKEKKQTIDDQKRSSLSKRMSEELLIENFSKFNYIKDDEKISLDGSIVSDVSHGSKNYIPKDLLFRDFFENTKITNGSQDLNEHKLFKSETNSIQSIPSPMNYKMESNNVNIKMFSPSLNNPNNNINNYFTGTIPELNEANFKLQFGYSGEDFEDNIGKTGTNKMGVIGGMNPSPGKNVKTSPQFLTKGNQNTMQNNLNNMNNMYPNNFSQNIFQQNINVPVHNSIFDSNMYHKMNPVAKFEIPLVDKLNSNSNMNTNTNSSSSNHKVFNNNYNNNYNHQSNNHKNNQRQKHQQEFRNHSQNYNNDYGMNVNSNMGGNLNNINKNHRKGGKNKKNNNYYDDYYEEDNMSGNMGIVDNYQNNHHMGNQGVNIFNSKHKSAKNFHRAQMNYLEMTDEEILENLFNIAKEQAGCRFLQKKIDDNPEYAEEVLFPAVFEGNLLDLMIDGFGNYLVQKMIEVTSNENLEKIIQTIHLKFLSLGLNAHGTRVIQKVIECIRSDRNLNLFLSTFHKHMMDLMKDVNGNHIIIKFVQTFSFPINSELYNEIIEHIVEIATHKHACCAFQKCVDAANEDQKRRIKERLVDNTNLLMSDPYGNYVLQYIIMLDDFETNYNIACIFKNNIGYLSKQKFSSNVIEKCFDHCDDNTKFMIVKEVCNPKIIVELLLDMYGNYVLQKALGCAKDPYYTLLINSIGPHLERLKTVSFGQKLYSKLLLTYPELNSFLVNSNQVKMNNNKPKKNNSKKNTNPNSNNNPKKHSNNGLNNMNIGNFNMNPLNNYNMNLGSNMNTMGGNMNHSNMNFMNQNSMGNFNNFPMNTQNNMMNRNNQYMNPRSINNNYNRKF